MRASVTDRLQARDVAVLAVAAALFAAFGNTLVVLFQRHILHQPGSASPEFAFLSPIGYLTVFAVLAIPLLLSVWLFPARVANRLIPGAFAAAASYALLSLITIIHPIALGLIAIGIGAQVGAAFGRRPAPALSRTRWLAGLCAGAVLATAGMTVALRQLRASRLESARGAADTSAPNIILLILDTVRAKNLSVYGYPRPTSPILERLAADGVTFEYSFSTGTFSAPSHASMLTGVWGSQTGANFTRRMHDTLPALPEILNADGYVSGAFVGNAAWAGRNVGLGKGFTYYVDFPQDFGQALASTTLTQSRTGRRLVAGVSNRNLQPIIAAIRHPDLRFTTFHERRRATPEIIEQFWHWRDGVEGRPYFAMLNFMDAHDPYLPPGRFRTMFGDGSKILDRYDGAIAYVDSLVGGIVDGLRKRGELERTVIVITADHGELLGEHGIEGHSKSVYPRAVRVPLILSGGGIQRGVRVAPPVSLRDLAATLLDVAGIHDDELPGTSLRKAWESGSNESVSPVVFEAPQGKNVGLDDLTRIGAIKGAADSTWYYIRYADGREEVFRWRTDSLESTNLIATAEGRAAADGLERLLERELGGDSSVVDVARADKR
jgi:arylsulfatase A-like enzyme